ncbi:M20 family metallo-hydrolase [Thauera sp. WH-2]|jgi:N-carbamoyl-L-amino-acid hydrolase|uniref:M20 family metallo-hydrolase n=1 Tax=Thauera sp. WH-2 TaxID=3401574 RepID=UPI003AAE9C27
MSATTPFPSLSEDASQAMAHVDGRRLIGLQRALANFGGREDGGVAREALTAAEREARRWLLQQVTGPRYSWHIDAAANLFLRRAGTDDSLPPVMTGSHIDTQPVGGWLDGAYGVIAGLEALLALDAAGIETRHPIELAIWTNEEGSRFSPGAMGSSAFVEPASLAASLLSTDAEGVRFEIERDTSVAAVPEASNVPLGRPVQAYVEAHIEQGPILEASGCRLGVVTGIQGVRWFEITVRGSSAHAGTTPLDNRRDALMTAATMVGRIGEMAVSLKDPALRLTVGRFEAAPGAINTVADRVTFTIDLRHPEDAVLAACERRIREIVAEGTGTCVAEVGRLMQRAPTIFANEVVSIVEAAVVASGEPYCRIVSGAFHDAMHLADHCPSAMLFVPSHGGISHNAAEDTDEADLIEGARVLAGVLVELSR